MGIENFWNKVYKETEAAKLPWYYPVLDGDVKKALKRLGLSGGLMLDLGTGPGTQAIALKKMGFDVVGMDISIEAIRQSRERARAEGVAIKFIRGNIIKARLKRRQFDCVLDRGIFHTINPENRQTYVKKMNGILKKDGVYLMKCFSTKTPGTWGPYRFTKDQIRDYFGSQFRILSMRDSIFQGPMGEQPKAIFCIMKPK